MNLVKLIVLILISVTCGVLSVPVSVPRPSDESKFLANPRPGKAVLDGKVPLNNPSTRSATDPADGDLETSETFIGLYGGWGGLGWGGYGGYGGYGYPYGGYGGYGGFGGHPYGGYGFYG